MPKLKFPNNRSKVEEKTSMFLSLLLNFDLHLIKLRIQSFQQKGNLCVEESVNMIFDKSGKLVIPSDEEYFDIEELNSI